MKIRLEHWTEGIPHYVHGHNGRISDRVEPHRDPCLCGCGGLALPGRRYINGHNARGRTLPELTKARIAAAAIGRPGLRGPDNPRFKRGWYITRHGYRMLTGHRGHPFAIGSDRSSIFEHRVVVETHLRKADPASEHLTEVEGVKYLAPWVEVHHLDGDKLNNEISNLEPLSKVEHARLHADLKRAAS